MNEPKPSYAVTDPDHLTAEQIEQLQFVLDQLSLHQLVQLAAQIKHICADPGFGMVTIVMKAGHPSRIESGKSSMLLRNLEDSQLHELME